MGALCLCNFVKIFVLFDDSLSQTALVFHRSETKNHQDIKMNFLNADIKRSLLLK